MIHNTNTIRKKLLWFCVIVAIIIGIFVYLHHTHRSSDTLAEDAVDLAIDSVAVSNAALFNADSAYVFCREQCNFGPRVMNTSAHAQCAAYIISKFSSYGLQVTEQDYVLPAFNGTPLESKNIIASLHPEATDRILLCAHWDSRPWADNDPNDDNHTKPVMGANDGASGVAVMIELARLLTTSNRIPSTLGIDFLCLDAEDYGSDGNEDSWALGAQYWAKNPHKKDYKAHFGILLDMVGGKGSHFYREILSDHFASWVVDDVWDAAAASGNSSLFVNTSGFAVTDDHKPLNITAHIPTIDIIAYYPDCTQSSFGPYWHTIYDTMENIDKNVLKAVGGTLTVVLLRQAELYAPSPCPQGRQD